MLASALANMDVASAEQHRSDLALNRIESEAPGSNRRVCSNRIDPVQGHPVVTESSGHQRQLGSYKKLTFH